MSPHIFHFTLLYITLLIPTSLTILTVHRQNLTFDLSTSSKGYYTRRLNLIEGNVSIDVINAPSNSGFFIVQAHSYRNKVLLNKSTKEFVIGTNIGLVEELVTPDIVYRYNLQSILTQNIEVLLAVVVYKKTDPIPGGCNMVYNTKYAPYQIVTYDDNMIKIDASPAKATHCDVIALPRLDMYHLYLEEETLDENSYFNGIENLLTVNNIKMYGTKISDSVKKLPLRRYYSAYRGTGSVFAIIATINNSSSAYIPAVTYACDINNWDESCLGPVSITWKVLCAVILFIGMFICQFGHRFFRTTMFVFGFIFGSFIFYIAANRGNAVALEQSIAYALLFGFAYGITWLVLWWRYGIPVLTVSLPVTFIGYITACIILHTGVADFHIFQNDLNYWSVVFCVIVPITVSLLFITEFANILACSVVGATAFIISVDHYLGGSIHYIILNNIRRAIVPKFNLAILDPPFQYKDIILSVAWAGLILVGIILQFKQQKGKPPFPPHRFIRRTSTERTPLLPGGVNGGNREYT